MINLVASKIGLFSAERGPDLPVMFGRISLKIILLFFSVPISIFHSPHSLPGFRGHRQKSNVQMSTDSTLNH